MEETKKKPTFTRKGNNYFIVAKNGRTSRHPFPHPTLKAAETEAKRLAGEFPNTPFYVFAAYYKVTNADDRIIKTHLRYKKPTRSQ